MKIYMAGPLFTFAERTFNTALAKHLIYDSHDIWLPQEREPRDLTAKNIFAEDVKGLDWCEVVLACMDGTDPDSGTAWECGYAYAKGKPVICYRTDFRNNEDFAGSRYNLMLSQSATENVFVSSLSQDGLISALNDALNRVESK